MLELGVYDALKGAVGALRRRMTASKQAAAPGDELVAAAVWRSPALSRAAGDRLELTRLALRWWFRLEPAGARLPLPY